MVLCLIVVSIMEARRIMENSLSHGSTGVLWPCLRPIFKLLYKASGLRRITIAKCPNDTVPFSLMFNLNKQVEEPIQFRRRHWQPALEISVPPPVGHAKPNTNVVEDRLDNR